MPFALVLALASAQIDQVKALAALDARVATIGDRLAKGGLCDAVLSAPGWVIQDQAQYGAALQEAARSALKLGTRPTIVFVVPDGAAARAGLEGGDEIVAVAGSDVAEKPGKDSYARVASIEASTEAALKEARMTVTFVRDGAVRTVPVASEKGCASRFQMQPGAQLNAVADGRYVQLSGALVEFARSDDELALAMAHELAHNILGHKARLDAAGVSRGLFTGIGKNRTRIRATEMEADRWALYLAARAGYDISVAPAFWERFGRKADPILSDGTHSGWRERVALATAEIARIEEQRAAGKAPTP